MILREARRFLLSSPLLSLSAIVILALGIGASTFALTLLLAFSSLTYPGMRHMGYATIAEETEGGGSVPITWKRFEDIRASSGENRKLAAYSSLINTTLEVNGGSSPLNAAAVSRGFFSVFTPELSAGRDFSRDEEDKAGNHVVVLSLPLAVRLFKSPAAALGRFVEIGWLSYQVVGVTPPGFAGLFGASVDAWVPANCVVPLILNPLDGGFANPVAWKGIASFFGVATSDEVSSTKLVANLTDWLPLRVATKATLHVSQGLTTDPVRDARLRKWLRLGFLLALVFTIVGGLNYSLLLLARTQRYAEEIRLKKILGAGNVRLMTELMIGPAVMVGAGLLAACLFSAGGLMLISRLSAFYEQLVRGSWQAALLAFGVQVPLACAATLVIALIPELALLRDTGVPQLGQTSTAVRQTGFFLQILVTLQISFCIGTWILAGMIVSAVTSLTKEGLGYDPSHLTVVCIGPASSTVAFTATSDQSFPSLSAIEGLLGQMKALPGVRSVSFAANAPFDSPMGTLEIQRMDSSSTVPLTVNDMAVSPGYFRSMGNRIVLGRDFSWGDLGASANEIVINEALAKELLPSRNTVGRSVRLIFPAFAGMSSFTSVATVVGIVEDMRLSGFAESSEPTIFRSLKGTSFVTSYLIVNGTGSIHVLQDIASRQVVAQMPGLAVQYAYSVGDRARASLWQEQERAYFALAGAFAMGLVAYIGLYGALAYYVNTRQRELAVRICLGALPWAILKIILVRAARCAAWAAIISLPLWPVLAQLSSSEYLGRVSWSTGRAILLSLTCVCIAVFISVVPAVRANRVSPADILKEQ